jgi:hypothetical protein
MLANDEIRGTNDESGRRETNDASRTTAFPHSLLTPLQDRRHRISTLTRTIHDWLVRFSRPAGLFSFGLLDGLHVRLRRPYLREAPAGFGLERLATAFMNNPG